MVEDTKENSEKCICGTCPSKDECMENNNEWFYCAREKSKCPISQKGCVCGACPIFSEYKLNDYYFCIKGKAK
jgi:hypothetical protein